MCGCDHHRYASCWVRVLLLSHVALTRRPTAGTPLVLTSSLTQMALTPRHCTSGLQPLHHVVRHAAVQGACQPLHSCVYVCVGGGDTQLHTQYHVQQLPHPSTNTPTHTQIPNHQNTCMVWVVYICPHPTGFQGGFYPVGVTFPLFSF